MRPAGRAAIALPFRRAIPPPQTAFGPGDTMPLKEWAADVEGHAIQVSNTWLGGAKLTIDGECRDTNRSLFAIVRPTKAHLSARLEQGNASSPLVEVFFQALLDVEAKICVDGKRVAGDLA